MTIQPALRLGELVATFALAQDNAFGQPLESQLRSCLLATWLCDEAGLDPSTRETVYWTALLRYIGCTGHAHEVAVVFGDEIAIRAQTLVHDAANPAEVMRDVLAFATAGKPVETHEQIARTLQEGVQAWAINNFAAGCEVADMLVERLGFADAVREALAFTFERWNGMGFPRGAAGEQIPLAMRVVHISHDMEAIARLFSPAEALEAVRNRRDRTYDPQLADVFARHGEGWFDQLAKIDPWDGVLEIEPAPHHTLSSAALDEALTVIADFIDLKSPYLAGFSRRCAELTAGAATVLKLDEATRTSLTRAALVHDLGMTAIANSILDKPSQLTRAEADRMEVHTLLTEQMLRRSPALAVLNPIAAAHHENADGTGFHKGLAAAACDPNAGLLAVANAYVSLTTERADRPAMSGASAALELRRRRAAGLLDGKATEAVLAAAGHFEPNEKATSSRLRPSTSWPAGLTDREVEVLRLAARGHTTREIAERLYISPKTADHHIQHVYTKIDVSARGAAALWAMQHGLVT